MDPENVSGGRNRVRVSTCRVLACAKYVPPDQLLSAAVGGNCLAAIEDSGHPRRRKRTVVVLGKLSQIGRLFVQRRSLGSVTFSIVAVAGAAVPDV
jgi:hypothetical protein